MTVDPGKYQGPSASDNKNPIPIEEVIRTRWPKANVSWNGRTRILWEILGVLGKNIIDKIKFC